MKIAFINQPWNYCPPIRGGSIAIWTHEVARRLSKSHDVIVYARSGLQERVEKKENVHYRRISTDLDRQYLRLLRRASKTPLLKRSPFAYGSFYALFGLKVAIDVKSQACNIIHIQNFSHFVPLIRFFNPNAKIVLHMHGEWLTQLDRHIIERRLKYADLILGCSEYITNKIRARFPHIAHRCMTVFDGVDIDLFSPIEKDESHSMPSKPQLLFVGRISPEKGLHILMEAMLKVAEINPAIELKLIGAQAKANEDFIVGVSKDPAITELARFYNGKYESHLLQQAYSGSKDRIRFEGYVPHDQLPGHYQSADILVNPSLSESFGMSLVEAMAAGVPVVATRVGGMVDIVESGVTGVLVEPNDPEDLANGITRILSDSEVYNRMRKAGRGRAVETFSWHQIAKDLINRYDGIVE